MQRHDACWAVALLCFAAGEERSKRTREKALAAVDVVLVASLQQRCSEWWLTGEKEEEREKRDEI